MKTSCTLREALNVARTGAVGAVDISEPWVHEGSDDVGPVGYSFASMGKSICAPGLVDLEYLRSLRGVREWRKDDAQ